MLELSLNYWQLILAIFVAIITFLLGLQTVKVLFKIFFTSKIMVNWNMKRQYEQQKVILKNRRLISKENLSMLAQLLEEINKSLPNNHSKKQFYQDFALNPSTREYWMKTFLERTEEPKSKEEIKLEKKR